MCLNDRVVSCFIFVTVIAKKSKVTKQMKKHVFINTLKDNKTHLTKHNHIMDNTTTLHFRQCNSSKKRSWITNISIPPSTPPPPPGAYVQVSERMESVVLQ